MKLESIIGLKSGKKAEFNYIVTKEAKEIEDIELHKLNANEILDLSKNSDTWVSEFEERMLQTAESKGYFGFVEVATTGDEKPRFVYHYAWQEDPKSKDDPWLLSSLEVYVTADNHRFGKICLTFGPTPLDEFDDESDALKYFKRLKRKYK